MDVVLDVLYMCYEINYFLDYSTVRSKIRNLIDRYLYPTVLSEVVYCTTYSIKLNVLGHENFPFDMNVNFIVKMNTVHTGTGSTINVLSSTVILIPI